MPGEQVLKHLPPIGFRFVAIAVVVGTGERRGPVFENRDIRAMALRITPHDEPRPGDSSSGQLVFRYLQNRYVRPRLTNTISFDGGDCCKKVPVMKPARFKGEDRWAIVDLIGKGGHVRTVPVPAWVKTAIDQWTDVRTSGPGGCFDVLARPGPFGEPA